jgi:hypothetical protein
MDYFYYNGSVARTQQDATPKGKKKKKENIPFREKLTGVGNGRN